MRKIPLAKPYFDSDEIRQVRKVLASGWVSKGPKAKELEEALAEYLGVRHCIAVTNCTAALHLALMSVGIKKGDEVLVADYTYPATAHAAVHCGARPVFVDVDPRTYNIDPDVIESKITRRTKAVMPVHTFGQPADMKAVVALAARRGLTVIEDAACALGAKYDGAFAGAMGEIGCFSLHARKGITTGEGGFAVTNNRRLADRMRRLSTFGMKRAFKIPKFIEAGYNYKMSDITAGIGIAQLRKLEKIIARRQHLAGCWNDALNEHALITAPYRAGNVRHVYQSYVALVDKRVDRDGLIRRLFKKGIETQIGTYALHIQPAYRSKDRCPNSLDIFRRAIALPIYYELEKRDIAAAAGIIKDTLEEMA